MQLRVLTVNFLTLVLSAADVGTEHRASTSHHHHHHRHHKHQATPVPNASAGAASAANATKGGEAAILHKMADLVGKLTTQEDQPQPLANGTIEINGPVPAGFAERFVQAASMAAGVNTVALRVLGIQSLGVKSDLAEVKFEGAKDVVLALENQAADPSSKLANSPLRSFLMAPGSDGEDVGSAPEDASEATHADMVGAEPEYSDHAVLESAEGSDGSQSPVAAKGIDIDTAMPYGELEPFGREDTAQELTESSVKESDEMVDQLERAEVAEEKRAVFRALTRLRGAAITSFDGVARSQTGNIDEYNKVHQWRHTHPLHHLADEESDISKWAFPDNAD